MTEVCGCQAWLYNSDVDADNKFALHQYSPNVPVSHEELGRIGVLYFRMDDLDEDEKLAKLRTERGYSEFDVVQINSSTPAEKLDIFFDEHLHEDEEIRLCLEGSGYFDVRGSGDQWIRIRCTPGDLLIVPAGIYHRFTLDENKYIKAMRLFTTAPKWIALSRALPETEALPSRSEHKAFVLAHRSGAGQAIVIDDGPQALANYPHARKAGGLIYLSGFSSRRADNTHRGADKLADGSFALDVFEQTRGVIENMQTVLRAAGADLSHLLDVTVFLTDMSNYKRFNEAYNLYFTAQSGPARTTVAVKQLPHPNLLIEIKGVAAVAKDV
jgi:reactive intermediate/imine deaminase